MGFTLAELLAVIVIMAIMLVTIVPSISGMTRSSNMRGATQMVKTTLGLARQWAITQRQPTNVLFPITSNNQGGKKGYHAIAAYSTNFIGEWIFMPAGVIIMQKSTVYSSGKTLTLPTQDRNGLGPNYIVPVLKFKATGSVDWPVAVAGLGDPSIMLTEGFLDDVGKAVKNPNSWTNTLYVNPLTGAVRF